MKQSRFRRKKLLIFLVGLACSGCGPSGFSGEPPSPSDGAKKKSGGESVPGSKETGKAAAAGEGFLPTGKSLDLYVIMDKSSSLSWVLDKSGNIAKGTDPNCKRFDALLDLIDEMRTRLVANEKVRLTIVTFGTDPKRWTDQKFWINGNPPTENVVRTLKVTEDVLASSRSSLDQTYRIGVCAENREPQYTHYAAGIGEALRTNASLVTLKKYDVSTALFFSDGAANDVDENELKTAMSNLNNAFPGRLWGVILGDASTVGLGGGLCTLKKAGNVQMTAEECMTVLVGSTADKLLRVTSAAGLSEALTGLVNRK